MTYNNNGLKFLIVSSLVVFVSAYFVDDNEAHDIRLWAAERECATKYDLIEDFGRRPIKQSRNHDLKDLRQYCFRKCLGEYNGDIKPDHTIDVERIIDALMKAKIGNAFIERVRGCMEGVKVIMCEDLKKVEECIFKPPRP